MGKQELKGKATSYLEFYEEYFEENEKLNKVEMCWYEKVSGQRSKVKIESGLTI